MGGGTPPHEMNHFCLFKPAGLRPSLPFHPYVSTCTKHKESERKACRAFRGTTSSLALAASVGALRRDMEGLADLWARVGLLQLRVN